MFATSAAAAAALPTASSSAASVMAGYAAQANIKQPLPSLRCSLGPYLFRADFDSANLESVKYVGDHPLESTTSPSHLSTPDIFHAWLSSDPCSTYRVWFYFSISGGTKGKQVHVVLKNMNNKKPLIGEGMHPVYRQASQSNWKRVHAIEFLTLKTDTRVCSFLRPNDETGEAGGAEGGEAGAGGEEGEGGSNEDEDSDGAEAAPSASPSGSPSHSRSGSTAASSTIAAPSAAAAAPSKKRIGSAKPKGKIKHDTMELTIKHTFEVGQEEVFFAFCLPHSYTQLQTQLLGYDRKFSSPSASSSSIYYHRTLLVHSLEGRRIDLLTISSTKGLLKGEYEEALPDLYPCPTERSKRTADIKKAFPHEVPSVAATAASSSSPSSSLASSSNSPEPRAELFSPSKPIALFSSRVHPGESPSAWMLNGLLEFLLSGDPRAVALRECFVIKIIPNLNPDGTAHGYYRTDTLGQNLNRFYLNPVLELQPSIYATRKLVESWSARGGEPSTATLLKSIDSLRLRGESPSSSTSPPKSSRLEFYLDLHAHAMKRGLFLFGNHITPADSPEHARNTSYAKLVQLNSPYLNMDACSFSKKGMTAKDARDGLSKEGAGRVAFYQLTGLKHCYTCEVNYHNGRIVNQLASLPERPTIHDAASASSSDDLTWQRDEYLLSQEALNGPPVQYGATHFQSMGRSLAVALLDLWERNPYSRLSANTEFSSLKDVEKWAKAYAVAPPKRLLKKLSKPKSAKEKGATSTEKPSASSSKATPKQSPNSSPRTKIVS